MAEMLSIVRDYGGHFEKNTGDGLMAYFGSTSSSLSEASITAVHCAAVMEAVNAQVITPWLQERGVQGVRFRIGIDSGEVTIARIGIHGQATQRVAVGCTANIACKIMRFAEDGGICIGNNTRTALSPNWQRKLVQLPETGFVYKQTSLPYEAWRVNYSLPHPPF